METAICLSIRSTDRSTQPVSRQQLWISLVGLVLGVFLIRFFFSLLTGRFFAPETWEYETIANHLLRGEGFIYEHMGTVYRSYCEPLYPFMTAGVYALTQHSQSALVLMQIFLSSVTVVLASICAYYVTGERRAILLTAFCLAIHPALLVYTTKLHPFILDSFFLTLLVVTAFYYSMKPSGWKAAGIGFITGFGILTRPTILMLVPLLLFWTWMKTSGSVPVRWRRMIWVAAAVLIVVAPWVVRNYQVQGQFMLTRSNTPFVFWLGNNPFFTGSAIDSHGEPVLWKTPLEFRDRILKEDELAQNHLFAESARAYVQADPFGFLKRTVQKLFYFWWFPPSAGIFYPSSWMGWYKVWWAIMGVTGIVGIRALLKRQINRERVWFILSVVGIMSVTQSLFYVEGRHRLALEPILYGLIGYGFFTLLDKRAQKASR